MAQTIKKLPAMWETWVRSLGWEDPLEKGIATHTSVLAWRISWTEEPGRLQPMGSQRVGHYWVTKHSIAHNYSFFLNPTTHRKQPETNNTKNVTTCITTTFARKSLQIFLTALRFNLYTWNLAVSDNKIQCFLVFLQSCITITILVKFIHPIKKDCPIVVTPYFC